MRTGAVVLAAMLALPCAAAPDAAKVASTESALLGRFDNREQFAKEASGATNAIPRVAVTIEATPQPDFTLWSVHVETDAQNAYDQTWAMQTQVQADGSGALIPYYQLRQDTAPVAAAFDAQKWLSLEACALRGTFSATHFEAISEGEPCVAVSMNVGARRALMPVAAMRSGDSLRIHLNLAGKRTSIEMRKVR